MNSISNNVWSSRWVFFVAATAGTVGLGNIWNFPIYMAENGGSAFVVLYLLCIILMGVPMMLSEVAIGHITRANSVFSIRDTALRSGASKHWSLMGYLGLLAGLCICVLLTVVGSWSISYLLEMYQGSFVDIGRTNALFVYSEIKANSNALFQYQTVFIATGVVILGFGVNKGLGRGLMYLVPMSLIILFILLYHSFSSGFVDQAFEYMFRFDASKLTIGSFLLAFEHAFYTLSIGIGSLIVFGAYLPKRGGIGPIVFSVALVDILISGLVGLVIIPSLFLSQIDPAGGYELLFVSLPTAYGDILNGQYLGTLFFIFVMLTALSSALVLIEPAVCWCSERFATGRWNAVIMVGFVVWLLSLASMDHWNYIHEITGYRYKLFDLLNLLTAQVLLPLAGLLVAVYAGWILKPSLVRDEMANTGMGGLYLWYFLIRFVVPSLFVLVLVLNQLDIKSIKLFF